jgi:hypothetical protein
MRRLVVFYRLWRAGGVAVARAALVVLVGGLLFAASAQAQGVDLLQAQLARGDDGLTLDYATKITLSPAVEDALHRGVPVYFQAQVAVLRSRWYWRDERVARPSRQWRLSFQPLTATWRLSTGGLSQSFPSLADALVPISRGTGWRLVESDKLEAGERYYVEFRLQLDSTQLPRPMQLDLGQDWKLGVERTLRLE